MKGKRAKLAQKKSNPTWLWAALVIIGLVIAVFAITNLTNPSQASTSYPAEISVSEAFDKREAGAYILDVREPEEWQQFHIPGATLIPLGQLEARLNEVPKDQEVVVVCRTGNRSATGRDILRNAGYTQVTSLAGGVTDWQAQGLPIESGN